MVMDKGKKISANYTYGNVAYDIQPERRPETRPIKRTKVGKSKKSKKALKVKLKLMRSVALLATITFLTLSRAAQINSATAGIRSLKKEIISMQKENANLEVQIASACNLKTIEETAVNSYKMTTPGSDSVKYIGVEELARVQESVNDNTKTGFDIKKLLGFND